MTEKKPEPKTPPPAAPPAEPPPNPAPATEIGGRKGPEPTRFNDWEKGGRCIDF